VCFFVSQGFAGCRQREDTPENERGIFENSQNRKQRNAGELVSAQA